MREGIEDEEGIMVTRVNVGGPARKAGVQTGDIIVKLDDTEITSMKNFRQALYAKQVGEKAILTVRRDGKEEQIEVTLQ